MLNGFLLFCNFNYSEMHKYTVTPEQIKDAVGVLEKNNITVSTEVMRGFSPKKEIELAAYDEYDNDLLIDIFMNNPEDVKFSIDSGKKVLRTDWETLTVNGGYVTYRNRDTASGYPEDEEAAKLCSMLVKRLEVFGGEFVLDGEPSKTDDGIVYEYCQKYKGNIIYSNFVSITVNEGGISRVDFMYLRPTGYVNTPLEICSADDALISGMHAIKNYFGTMEADISKVDLVYYCEENQSEKNLTFTVSPYYRVYFSLSEEPLLVNAYTNSVSQI